MPLNELKAGIEIIDTPGFGTLNEELMMNFIKSAINQSDAVVIILDISQGIKKSENEIFLKLLTLIRPDKRYIVFNKIDSCEEEEENFSLVGKAAINKMNDMLKDQGYDQKIDTNQLFYISAKEALSAFVKEKKGESLDERAEKYKKIFKEFEEKFWNDVISYKQKAFLSHKIDSFNKAKEYISREIDSFYKNLSNQLSSLKSEKETILREQHEITWMAKRLEKKANKSIDYLKNIEVNVDELVNEIAEKIIDRSKVLQYVEENFGFFSSIFKKGELEREINRRLNNVDTKEIVEEVIRKYYGPIVEKIKSDIEEYKEEVDEYNSKLEKMGIKKFRFPKIEIQEKNVKGKQMATQIEVERANIFSPIAGYMTGAIVGGLLETAALGTVVGAAGLVAGIILGIVFASKSVNKKKEELKQKIKEGVYSSLYNLKEEIDKLNDNFKDVIYNIRRRFDEVNFISSEIIKTLERADLDEKIKDIEKQLNELQNIARTLEMELITEEV